MTTNILGLSETKTKPDKPDKIVLFKRICISNLTNLFAQFEVLSGVYLIFLVNLSAGQVLSKRYQPDCKLTSLNIESQ